jgi:TrmH family RNA methyltransferase
VAALARKKDRLAERHFLVEGPQAVRELLLHAPAQAKIVYATMGSEAWQFEIDRLANDAQVDVERVTDAVLAAMAETVQPQGVLAVAEMAEVPLTTALEGARLVAVLHEVRDPGNAGAVLRAADAAGADAVVFAGASIDPWHPKVVRATTGSLFHLPVVQTATLDDAVQAAHGAGLSVFAADVHGDDLQTDAEFLRDPVAWVFGNEAHGLTAADRQLADRVLRLPLFGKAESLNLATAASVCLYTTAFAQRK